MVRIGASTVSDGSQTLHAAVFLNLRDGSLWKSVALIPETLTSVGRSRHLEYFLQTQDVNMTILTCGKQLSTQQVDVNFSASTEHCILLSKNTGYEKHMSLSLRTVRSNSNPEPQSMSRGRGKSVDWRFRQSLIKAPTAGEPRRWEWDHCLWESSWALSPKSDNRWCCGWWCEQQKHITWAHVHDSTQHQL